MTKYSWLGTQGEKMLSDVKVEVLNDELVKLKRTRTELEAQIIQDTTRPLVYRAQNAGYLLGTDTVDAGRVYGRTVYKVMVSRHSNAAVWFIGAQFNYYLNLPRIGGRVWRTASEHEKHLDSLYDQYRKVELQIREYEVHFNN